MITYALRLALKLGEQVGNLRVKCRWLVEFLGVRNFRSFEIFHVLRIFEVPKVLILTWS